MMRFKSLGSGSTGNAWVIEEKARNGGFTRVLIDCGFTQKELLLRLEQAGLTPEDLSAIFITHEHSDHMGCAPQFAKRWNIPLWMSEGTAFHLEDLVLDLNIQYACDGSAFEVGSLRFTPFTVPHDAREPLQLKVDNGRKRLALVTDLGKVTDYVVQNIYNCHALVLEFNHDAKMLAQSKYPAYLKRRVASSFGHLSNEVAFDVLKDVMHGELQHVIAAHLSQENNVPELVTEGISTLLNGTPKDVCIADAKEGTPWLNIA